MSRIFPFLCFSVALHALAVVGLAKIIPAPPGLAGSLDGDPDRVFVCVVHEEEVTATAPTPSPVDAPEAVESKEVAEPVPPEPAPEILAKEEPQVPPDFTTMPIDEIPEPEPVPEKPEKEPEKEQEESTPSVPQTASDVQKRRASLGEDLRDFQSLLAAAIRQAGFFPREAVRKRRHGEVTVRFAINSDGEVTLVDVVKSSGSPVLDEAAKEIIRRAAQDFPSFPSGLAKEELQYTVPIRFKRRGRSGAS